MVVGNECLTIGITLPFLILNSSRFTPPTPLCSSQSPISGMASLSTQVLCSKNSYSFSFLFFPSWSFICKIWQLYQPPKQALSYSLPWLLVCFLHSRSTMSKCRVVCLPGNVCVPTYTPGSLRAGPLFILFIRLYSIISTGPSMSQKLNTFSTNE